MMQSFIALQGENIYDLTIRAYEDIRGYGSLIMLNNFTDYNQADYTGQVIFYDDELKFVKTVSEAFIPEREFLDDYLVYEQQSIYDLAIQLYGDINEGMKELVPLIKELDRGGAIPQGTLLKRKTPVSNIAEVFNNENLIIATTPTPPILDCILNFASINQDKVNYGRQNLINYNGRDTIEITFSCRVTVGEQYAFSQGNNSFWRQRWGIGVKDGDLYINFFDAQFTHVIDMTQEQTVRLELSHETSFGDTVDIFVNDSQVGQLLGINTGILVTDFLVLVLGAYHNGGSGDHPSEGTPIIDSYSGYLDGTIRRARFNDHLIPINEGSGNIAATSSNKDGIITTIDPEGIEYINSSMWDCAVDGGEEGLESGLEFSLVG